MIYWIIGVVCFFILLILIIPDYKQKNPGQEGKPIVFFDGVCGLCNRFVDFLIRHDKNRVLLFTTLQGETARAKIKSEAATDLNTVILWKDGEFYYRSSAAIRLFMLLGGAWKLMGIFLIVPPFIRNAVYGLIAKYRYRIFGKREACRMSTAEERTVFID